MTTPQFRGVQAKKMPVNKRCRVDLCRRRKRKQRNGRWKSSFEQHEQPWRCRLRKNGTIHFAKLSAAGINKDGADASHYKHSRSNPTNKQII